MTKAGEYGIYFAMQQNNKAKSSAAGMDVPYVARLARLALTDEETALFQRQLGQVVDYMRELGELDLAGVEPMAHTTKLRNVLRPDEPRPGLARETVLANAPCHDDNQFVVPKIM